MSLTLKQKPNKTVKAEETEKSADRWEKLILWYWYFIIGAFLGWVYEIFVYIFEFQEGFVNRGFLFGPYLPVYGFGSLAVVFLLVPLKNKRLKVGRVPVSPVLCFIFSVIITSVIELITSYLMEWATGGWLWDYTIYKINFDGRVALDTSLRFGILTLMFLYIVMKLIEKISPLIKKHNVIYRTVSAVVFVIFMADVIVNIAALFGYRLMP